MPKEMFKDLGLSYLQAASGVQSAIAHNIQYNRNSGAEPKHLRVGIDLAKAEQFGLASLLVDKGVITFEEYEEYMRLAVNTELANFEEEINTASGIIMSFR